MIEKFKNLVIILLLGCLVIFQFITHQKDAALQKLQSENLQLNEKIKSIIQIQGNQVKIVYKEGKPGKNTETIKYVNVYIPHESPHTTITTDTDGHVTVDTQKYGTGFWPFIGLGYSNKLKPMLGARLAYYERWGVGLSTGFDGLALFSDVRTDWDLFKNSSFGLFYDTNKNLGVSIHTFL
jgi:hypothetical protein